MVKSGIQYKALTSLEPYTPSIGDRTAKAFYHKEQPQREVAVLKMMFSPEMLSQAESEKLSFGPRNTPPLAFPAYSVFVHSCSSLPSTCC